VRKDNTIKQLQGKLEMASNMNGLTMKKLERFRGALQERTEVHQMLTGNLQKQLNALSMKNREYEQQLKQQNGSPLALYSRPRTAGSTDEPADFQYALDRKEAEHAAALDGLNKAHAQALDRAEQQHAAKLRQVESPKRQKVRMSPANSPASKLPPLSGKQELASASSIKEEKGEEGEDISKTLAKARRMTVKSISNLELVSSKEITEEDKKRIRQQKVRSCSPFHTAALYHKPALAHTPLRCCSHIHYYQWQNAPMGRRPSEFMKHIQARQRFTGAIKAVMFTNAMKGMTKMGGAAQARERIEQKKGGAAPAPAPAVFITAPKDG
jgi:hypothetical protein